jgi:hypothetical protein
LPRKPPWLLGREQPQQRRKEYLDIRQGQTLFLIGEVLARAGVSGSTQFRWVRLARIPDTQFKDRNARRVFTEGEVNRLPNVAHHQTNRCTDEARIRGCEDVTDVFQKQSEVG